MTHGKEEVINALTAEIEQKAIRTFIHGLKSIATRNMLYGQNPRTLGESYALSQTMYHDTQCQGLNHILKPSLSPRYAQRPQQPIFEHNQFQHRKGKSFPKQKSDSES